MLVRPARPDDPPFLALAMQEADRGHTGIGSWDILFPGPEEPRLALLAALARASQRSYMHWSTFVVAEIEGRLVGTAAGYVPRDLPSEHSEAALREVLGPDEKSLDGHGAFSREYFSVPIPQGTLRLEWVYTDPEFRRKGVSSGLIAQVLADARARGIATAHVGTYIGNEPAIATYRRAGFSTFAESRHTDYEERFGAPGTVSMRRIL